MAEMSGKSDTQLDSEHFSPYRADGKLVGRFFWFTSKRKRRDLAKELSSFGTQLMSVFIQYGFVCVVTGATAPVGKSIVAELAGPSPISPIPPPH
jgi:hypothetical protein